MKNLLFLILTAVVISSCGKKSNTETSNADSIIRIDLLSETEERVTKLSEIAANVEYIPVTNIGEFVNRPHGTKSNQYK